MNKLYIIPTPIGNMGDMTERSLTILKSVGVILCENSKISGKIKKYANSDAKLLSLHKFNEKSRIEEVKKILLETNVALISDAGTPTISDPGQSLIKELKKEKSFSVIPLPGACSITTAISGSGLEFNSFSFIGFLEKEEIKIIKIIKNHLNSDIIVCYESPNRIKKTLEIIKNNFGDINIVIARELTKIHEEIINDKISNLLSKDYKGEIVLIIPTKEISIEKDYVKSIILLKKLGISNKEIIFFLKETTDFKKNDIYNYLKTIK